jgi:sugar (pentulose or hexulose) kinase
MESIRLARYLALDVTTTEFALAVQDEQGQEDYAAVSMRGATAWQDDPAFPAFQLGEVAGMLQDLLTQLRERGWQFDRRGQEQPGYLSVACRQHDMVLLDRNARPLLPAISWQCNAARDEVAALQQLGVERSVGTIEPRFVLPKLACVLNRQPAVRERLGTVFMTGDWIALQLTGLRSLSTSDALSNGLLDQQSRGRADDVIGQAGFDLDWFPEVVQSGTVVGSVTAGGAGEDDAWNALRQELQGWQFVAGLGDNHASAVGCGMTDDYRKLVVSGGTSGTINLSCPKAAELPDDGDSLQFEFYGQSLLLLQMLGDCGAWYNRFVQQLDPEHARSLAEWNERAMASNPAAIRRVLHDDVHHAESFAPNWSDSAPAQRVASTQFSIVLELLLRVQRMVDEVRQAGALQVDSYVLTGGLSQSPFFQQVFHTGIGLIAPGAAVKVSGRTGPLRYKTSAYGALINAQLAATAGGLMALHGAADRFPLTACAVPAADREEWLRYLLQSYGVGAATPQA